MSGKVQRQLGKTALQTEPANQYNTGEPKPKLLASGLFWMGLLVGAVVGGGLLAMSLSGYGAAVGDFLLLLMRLFLMVLIVPAVIIWIVRRVRKETRHSWSPLVLGLGLLWLAAGVVQWIILSVS